MSEASLTYHFEELPLLTEVRRFGVVQAGMQHGRAEISYEIDGSWYPSRIWLTATSGIDDEAIEIGRDRNDPFFLMMVAALKRDPSDIIAGKVQREIAAGAFDDRSDYEHDMKAAA